MYPQPSLFLHGYSLMYCLCTFTPPSLPQKYEFKQTPPTGWWGAKYFASAGAMGSIEDEAEGEEPGAVPPPGKQRQAFDEGDQEALYMLAHDHQRVGRRGLGKSDTLKIAGKGEPGRLQ